jgi:aryl-alcohol dehydrogenase-like predicted oxidoreductase
VGCHGESVEGSRDVRTQDAVGPVGAQVVLAWLRYRPVPAILMIGARKLTQLQDNLASSELALSAEQLKTLEEASRIELGFPMDMYAKDFVRAIAYVGLRDKIIV